MDRPLREAEGATRGKSSCPIGGSCGAVHLQTLARTIHEAWHQLAERDQQRLLGQVTEALDTTGSKELVICDAAWSNERWPFFGIEEFPDLDAVQRHAQILTDLNWARYMKSRTILGTELILPVDA